MARKTILAIALIGLGVGVGTLVISTYTLSGGQPAITLAIMLVATTCIIAGTVVAFSRILDRLISPVLDELHHDIEDDIRDLQAHRLTSTFWMVLILAITVVAFSFFVFRFHKLEAMWGPVPVVIPTFVAVGILAWFIPRSRWFRKYQYYTPMGIFFIPVIGLIISVGLGLGKTENMSILSSPPQKTANFGYNQYTGVILQGVDIFGDLGIVPNLPDCDDDICGVIFMVIILVVLTFLLVAGSASIPHFWLLSGSIFLGIMALIAIHDLRIRRAAVSEPAVSS